MRIKACDHCGRQGGMAKETIVKGTVTTVEWRCAWCHGPAQLSTYQREVARRFQSLQARLAKVGDER